MHQKLTFTVYGYIFYSVNQFSIKDCRSFLRIVNTNIIRISNMVTLNDRSKLTKTNIYIYFFVHKIFNRVLEKRNKPKLKYNKVKKVLCGRVNSNTDHTTLRKNIDLSKL